MKKFLLITLILITVTACCVGAAYWRYVPSVRPMTVVGAASIGNLNRKDATAKLSEWWKTERDQPITLTHRLLGKKLIHVKPSDIGIELDLRTTLDKVHFSTLGETAIMVFQSSQKEPEKIEPTFDLSKSNLDKLKTAVENSIGGRKPARAYFVNGVIERQPEVSGSTLDEVKFKEMLGKAIIEKTPLEIPLIEAPKRVKDEDLDQIVEVVSTFKTRFPAKQYSRTSNIRTAAGKFNGIVLAPNERISFNSTVGKRTLDNGFKLAPVYKNGKHDIGVGGGICQVSTTLYNCALFADLKIVRRQNHSMPVAYVPVGRDATVDYGGIDLVLENTYDTPIAISSEFNAGSLSFTILGKRNPALSVKIISSDHRSWNPGIKSVFDATVAAGKTKVIEKGSLGHSINTYRLVYENGKLVRRDNLGRSFYKGGVRIVASGTKKPAVAATPDEPVIDNENQ